MTERERGEVKRRREGTTAGHRVRRLRAEGCFRALGARRRHARCPARAPEREMYAIRARAPRFRPRREHQTTDLLPETVFFARRERRRPPALPGSPARPRRCHTLLLPPGQLPLLPAASTSSESPIALGRRSLAAAEPRNARLRCQVLPGPDFRERRFCKYLLMRILHFCLGEISPRHY